MVLGKVLPYFVIGIVDVAIAVVIGRLVFSFHNMPAPIHVIIYIVPARYFVAMLKGIYLKGISLEIL